MNQIKWDKFIETKVCDKCRKVKSVSEFAEDKDREDGLYNWCKQCKGEIHNRYRHWARRTKAGHRVRGFKVNLLQSDLEQLAMGTLSCPLCGCQLDWSVGKGRPADNSPTLDRKENQNILNLDNIWIICYRCNWAKGKMPLPEFIGYCELIYKRYNKIWA